MQAEGPVILIAAHPDDETIGAGIRMTRWDARKLTIVHITDGSPRNHPGREQYAKTRRRELYEALALAGIGEDRCRQLDFIDQETYLHLPEVVDKIAALVREIRPDAVYTHPYEGGHPDHDAAALAVAQVCHAREFTSYHAGDGETGPQGIVTGEFLGGGNIEIVHLSDADRELKRKMFQCFRSQEMVLRNFALGPEKFRVAPQYDFTQPPHPGQLHYEKLGWNITGQMWRAEAMKLLSMRTIV